MRNQNLGVGFLRNFAVGLDEIQFLDTTYWFVEAHANFLCTSDI